MARAGATVALTALVVATLIFPHPPADVALAAPAALDASFRDLPASVRAGDSLGVQVGVTSGATCDGVITYRDGATQNLDSLNESGGRCRWNLIVLSDARRGTADITVNVHKGSDQTSIAASIEVTRRGDDVNATFHDLPGIVERGDSVDLRVDVDDDASCQGTIAYQDARTQILAAQTETRNRCRWTFTVPADAAYGVVRMIIGVTVGSSSTTLSGSFDVERQGNGAKLVLGLKDLPAAVNHDDSFIVRALVPSGATCTGSVAYFGVAPQPLNSVNEADGECQWTARVPSDVRAGIAEIDVTAAQDSDSQTAVAVIGVNRSTSDVDASFQDLADSVQRGDGLDIRVRVPDNATCSASIAYQDSDPTPLAATSERRNRCVWEIDVPSNAPRGTATVRVTVNDGASSSTLTSNVEVLAKGDVSKASWDDNLPNSVKAGDSFDLKVRVPNSATCSGTVTYADNSQSALQSRDEDGSRCRWKVSVPSSAGAGAAAVSVSVTKDGRETKLTGSFTVAAPDA